MPRGFAILNMLLTFNWSFQKYKLNPRTMAAKQYVIDKGGEQHWPLDICPCPNQLSMGNIDKW